MSEKTLARAVDFFFPYLADRPFVFFYGGEPLMAFDRIVQAVGAFGEKSREREKNILFSLSTNGALMNERKLEFFHRHRFDVLVSYDGLTQDTSRHPGTARRTLRTLETIKKYDGINLLINSVYSPETVERLSESMISIIESGFKKVRLGLCMDCPWDDPGLDILEEQLELLSQYLLEYRGKHGFVPVPAFAGPPRKPVDVAKCSAGTSMMSLSPRETVWGCHTFHAYFKNKPDDPDYATYSFGTLDEFMKKPEEIHQTINAKLNALRQDFYFTEEKPCFACDEVNECMSCPVSAAYVTSFIGKIPPWHCRFHKVYGSAKKKFAAAVAKQKQE